MKRAVYILILSLVIWSCQQENYDLKINNGDPILVVDARVQSHAGNVIVKLSKSTDFLGDNPQKIISDATVFIAVDGGEEQLLEYLEDGNYILDTVKVDPGTEYALRIVSGEEEYTATTTMLEIVPITTFLFEETPSFGPQNDGPQFNFNMLLNTDLSEVDYYLTEASVYDTILEEFADKEFQQWDDEAYNTNPAFFPFFVREFGLEDSIYVKFSHISKETFDFYNSLTEVGGQNPSSLAPANPTSNISNGAIGTFGAYATFESRFRVNP